MAKTLIEKGSDINAKDNLGYTPLINACQFEMEKDYNFLELLIDNGADLEAEDNSGETPLQTAICSNATENVKYLVKRGSDFNKKDKDGLTPLNLAYDENSDGVNDEIIEFLESKGAVS